METDYLIVGAGAVGLAFADTLLDETDAHITLVDRRARPGGHWVDAYPFVALHQPSAFYGVNSTELGTFRKDTSGPNAGLYELAGGAEILSYFDRLMQHRLLPSGRVSYQPMSDWRGDGRIVSLLGGGETQVTVRRKVVDATWFSPGIPATHTPSFKVAEGVRVVPPNALPQLWIQRHGDEPAPQRFCVLGAGKTAMDAIVWLLRHGAAADAIQWVVPRDSWIQNRQHTQPGTEFFEHTIGGHADKLGAFARAESIDDLFARLESLGQMLRVDRSHKPTMFHFATISQGEIELLRQVTRVIRQGRVLSVEAGALVMEQGRVAMEHDVLYVDCTASAIVHNASVPVFQPGRVTVQLLQAPLVTLSAAITAWVEAHGEDDAGKNKLCTPVSLGRELSGYAVAMHGSMMNQFAWSQHKPLRNWIRNGRLDGFGKLVSEVPADDAPRQAILARLRENGMAAMQNMQRLV